jgi:hypothetical protein
MTTAETRATDHTTVDEVISAIVAGYERHQEAMRRAGYARATAPRRMTVDSLDSAERAADDVLRPMLTGIHKWLVSPRRGESIRAYARRATRCAAARCAEAGVAAPPAIAHAGAETLGMMTAHVYRPRRRGVQIVSDLERLAGIE